MSFSNPEASYAHSLQTLDLLYEHDDFMESVNSVVDLGCGSGLDLEWWATRTTRDENRTPLNIKCYGVDVYDRLPIAQQYKNIQYKQQNFEDPIKFTKHKFDVAWCHDSFQYVIDPFATLQNWYNAININGMLIITLPQTTNMEYNTQAFDQPDYCYFNWTLVSLMHVLAVSGFDCADGFFYKNFDDPWIRAVVYKSEHKPMDPRVTRWYELADKCLLPKSAVDSLNRHGFVRQRDLVLPWLDKSLHSYLRH